MNSWSNSQHSSMNLGACMGDMLKLRPKLTNHAHVNFMKSNNFTRNGDLTLGKC